LDKRIKVNTWLISIFITLLIGLINLKSLLISDSSTTGSGSSEALVVLDISNVKITEVLTYSVI